MEDRQSSTLDNILGVATITSLIITLVALWLYAPHWIFWGLVVIFLTCMVTLMLDFTIRRITRFTWRDIGQFGTMGQPLIGQAKLFAPQSSAAAALEPKTKITLEVPTVAQLLEKGLLGTADLLLGYTMEGEPYYGAWDNVRTFAIAGKGRSGKTVTMFFLIIQALLNDCRVWVADPHASKKSSITSLLQPLAHVIRFARTDGEIAQLTSDFIDVMERRISGESRDQTPMLLVTDEFTRMVENNEQVYEAVVACAQQYAGVNGFAMIAGHEWTGNSRKLVKLRRAIHAKFVHRLDEGYAKYLLNSGKYARIAEKLHTGYTYFQDTEGDIHELKTPLGTREDAATIAKLLPQLTGVQAPYEIETFETEQRKISAPETDPFMQAETMPFNGNEQILSLPPAPERHGFSSYQGRKQEVMRLRGLNFKQSEIIFRIWGARPGETQTYQDALAEYKHILEEILVGA